MNYWPTPAKLENISIYESRYSRMYQIKFEEDNF